MELKIHPDLAAFLPDCDEDDDKALEQDIVDSGGARDPIVVWSGQGYIIDGHRRYRFCKKHGLPFKTEDMIFDSLSEAMAFMEKWQFMRRNMTPAQRALATQKMVQRRMLDASEGQTKVAAVAEIAAATNRSERQVFRDLALAEVIEQSPAEIKEAAKELRASEVSKIAEIPKERQQQIAAVEDRKERTKALKEEIRQVGKTVVSSPKAVQDAMDTLASLQKQLRDLANDAGRMEDFKSLRFNVTKIYDWLNDLKGE